MYRNAISRPGNSIPNIRSPIETLATGPSSTTTIEGGMMVPSEPPAQITPEISALSYLYLSITGMVSRPTTVSVAPITPEEAANTTHIRMVAMASPPGSRRVHRWIASNRRSAMPARSSIAPMKMNSGTAASTKFDAMASIFWMNWKMIEGPNAQ